MKEDTKENKGHGLGFSSIQVCYKGHYWDSWQKSES